MYLKNKNETGYADVQINYGIVGDKLVTGDWDNDGVDTIGYADWVFALGIPGDVPIAGNWDGIP